jgi:hypothetical protein
MTTPSHPVPPDPLIDEVRAIRRKIGEQYGGDIRRWMEDLRREQEKLGNRLVRPPLPERSDRVA